MLRPRPLVLPFYCEVVSEARSPAGLPCNVVWELCTEGYCASMNFLKIDSVRVIHSFIHSFIQLFCN